MELPLIRNLQPTCSSLSRRLPGQVKLALLAAGLAAGVTLGVQDLLPPPAGSPDAGGASARLYPSVPLPGPTRDAFVMAWPPADAWAIDSGTGFDPSGRAIRISPYDRLIRAAADSAGVDWRLVAAIISQESGFDRNAVSSAGAVGLMQLLPVRGGPSPEALTDPAVNIRAGVRRLRGIWDSYARADSLDRWSLTLATYHAGEGRIYAARSAAVRAGWDPDEWVGGVARSLIRLAQELNGANGRGFPGRSTVAYVRSVLDRYRAYAGLPPSGPEQPPPADSAAPSAAPSAEPSAAAPSTAS